MPSAPDPHDPRIAETEPAGSVLRRRLQGINLYLVGMMGAGKSAAGRPLAAALGYRFIDADAVLERACERSIPEIFAAEGEEAFRSIESSVLDQIAQWHSLVVATGGGVVTRPRNWGSLRQGVVVWLDAPEELLQRRLTLDPTPRPLLTGPEGLRRLQALLAERRPLYGEADLRIMQEEGEDPHQVAQRVLEGLPGILKQGG